MKQVLILLAITVIFSACTEYEYETVIEVPVIQNDERYFEIHSFRVRCESVKFEYNECELGNRLPDNAIDVELKVVKRYSDELCHFDQSYGFYSDDVIFVNDGCRALFEIKYKVEVFESNETIE